PLSVCISYMLAGPIINAVVLTSTYVAFSKYGFYGGPLGVVVVRAGLGFLLALLTAGVVEWQYRAHRNNLPLSRLPPKGHADAEGQDGPRTWWDRLNNISGTALNDFVDIMAFLVIGAALAAIGRGLLRGAVDESASSTIANIVQEPALAILIMMGLAIAFCLCSEADAFVAANFPLIWPDASKLAFLVLGPMLDFKLYMMYTRVFRPRLIWTIITCVVVQVFFYTLIIHYTIGDTRDPTVVAPSTTTSTTRT